MTSSRQALGRWGETLAANYLDGNGYRIIERNIRYPFGEIDLIAEEGSAFIFVEVKIRSTDIFGHARRIHLPTETPIFYCSCSVIFASNFHF